MSLGSGTLSTSCGNITVNPGSAFSVDSGAAIDNRDVNIAGGTINGGSGTIVLSGNWTNSGVFNPGTGTVSFEDGCGTAVSQLTGDTTFATFNVASSTGKSLVVASGSTQAFLQRMSLTGVSGTRLLVRSSIAGSVANFILDTSATQLVDWVDVADNDASGGRRIAPGNPSAFDSFDAGNVFNWFMNALPSGPALRIDTIPTPGLLLLMILLALLGRRYLRGSVARLQ